MTQSVATLADPREYVTLTVNGQLFGIPVMDVHDVLKPMPLTRVPLAPPEIAGVLNLRGRIVTAINMRVRLQLPPAAQRGMSLVVEYKGEFYSLEVDRVGEVLGCDAADLQPVPPTLDAAWQDVVAGVYRLEGQLLAVIDIAALLTFSGAADNGLGKEKI